jgi:hypothetical protein
MAILAASTVALTACHAQEAVKEQETSVGLAQGDGQRPALTPLRGETSGRAVQEVLEVKRQYDEAQLKNDSAWFERMFADDYVFVMPDSSVVTKTQAVQELRSRDIRWDSAVGEDMGVRVFEGMPVDLVAARSTLTGEHLAAFVDRRPATSSSRRMAEGRRPRSTRG